MYKELFGVVDSHFKGNIGAWSDSSLPHDLLYPRENNHVTGQT